MSNNIPLKLQGRQIFPGVVEGEALVSHSAISFFGGVDPETGIIVEKGHELEGCCLSGKILVFPSGKGSTVGSYTLYRLKLNDRAPAGIVNAACETITAVGCIISEIPCIDHIALDMLQTGVWLRLDGEQGVIEILNSLAVQDAAAQPG